MNQVSINLHDRIFKCGAGTSTSSAPVILQATSSASRPLYYKEWSHDTMSKAIDAVTTKGFTVRRAALEFNVPRSTLNDRITGRVPHGKKSGKSKHLSDEEEEELVQFLLRCATIGYPRTRQEVIAVVSKACRLRGKDINVTHGWWESFCKRHNSISLRSLSHLSLSRARASNNQVLESYFDALEETFAKYNFTSKPSQIFNVDESGMPLNPPKPKGVCKRGEKNPISISSDRKNQVTVVGCVNAAGYCIPPMVIWNRKTLHPDMTVDELPGTFYGLSPKGWIDQELFHLWFQRHFLRYAPPVRPLLLLMDGHSSHYCPDTINLASESGVILFTLPPNTTHITQPLDKGCFGPLKSEWKKVCHEYMASNVGKVVTQYSFSPLLSRAWMKSMTMRNICSGFRVTGIYPLDRTKLLKPEDSSAKKLSSSEVITFHPMLHTPINPPTKMSCSPSCSENDDTASTDCKEWKEMYSSYERLSLSGQERKQVSDSSETDSVKMIIQRSRPLKDVLKYPTPLKYPPPVHSCKSSRVLTSAENLEKLKEKQKAKEEKQREKEIRAKEREEKKRKKQSKGTCHKYHCLISMTKWLH